MKASSPASPFFYYLLFAVMVLLAAAQAATGSMFGFIQSEGTDALLTGLTFFVGDLAMVAFAHHMLPRWFVKFMAWPCLAGLFALSVFASAGYMMARQYEADSYPVQSRQKMIAMLEQQYETFGPENPINQRRTLDKIQSINKEIDRITGGSYVAPSSAIFAYIAQVTGYTVALVTLFCRLFWSAVFVMSSICSAGLIRHTRIEKKQPVKIESETKNVTGNAGNGYFEQKEAEITPENVSFWERYQACKQLVASGEVTPSCRQLRQAGRLQNAQAVAYLRRMGEEGIVERSGNRWVKK